MTAASCSPVSGLRRVARPTPPPLGRVDGPDPRRSTIRGQLIQSTTIREGGSRSRRRLSRQGRRRRARSVTPHHRRLDFCQGPGAANWAVFWTSWTGWTGWMLPRCCHDHRRQADRVYQPPSLVCRPSSFPRAPRRGCREDPYRSSRGDRQHSADAAVADRAGVGRVPSGRVAGQLAAGQGG